MHGPYRKRDERHATQIECLACGATRVVFGLSRAETGECERCHYVGWTYPDELDGTTQRMIMNGAFAGQQTGPRGGLRRDTRRP
jgi:uncharacterized paraquat-inducible protein A